MRIISQSTEQTSQNDRLDRWRQRWIMHGFRQQILHMGHLFSNFHRVDELLELLAPRSDDPVGREPRMWIRVIAEIIGFMVMLGAGFGFLIYAIGLLGAVTGIDTRV
jgi:hypothetical protein